MTGPMRLVGALFLVAAVVATPRELFAQDNQTGFAATVGLGVGVPYGVLGGGVEVGVPFVSFVGGVGTAVAGTGWGVGVKVHFVDRSKRVRPFATVAYGVTAAVITIGGGSDYTLKGVAFYGGIDWDFGPMGGWLLSFGVGGSKTDDPLPGDDIGTPFKVLFGVNYRFGSK